MVPIIRQFEKLFIRYSKFKGVSKWNRLSFIPTRTQITHNPNKNGNHSTLYRQLYAKIKACGPITVADYMKEVLIHPTSGYYMTKDVFGREGDFVTSPEISQLFGEMIAVWIIHEWHKISRDPFQLVELGPGKGSLMDDIIRVFRRIKLLDMVSVHLVEISPFLSDIQAKKLCIEIKEIKENEKSDITHYKEGITKDGVKIFWYRSILDVPKKFSVFVAHEFFDALPIHKFQKVDQNWKEVMIDVSENTDEEKFCYVLSPSSTPACLYISKNEQRNHVEISPQTMVITEYMSTFLYENGGFALIIDYGNSENKTDTFRAFKGHKLHDPLLKPGSADLTADVDFSVIKTIAEKDDKLITFGPINQGQFLRNLGIDVRLEQLLKNATEEQKASVLSGYKMITDTDKMGERFKVLSMFPSVLKQYFEKRPVTGF